MDAQFYIENYKKINSVVLLEHNTSVMQGSPFALARADIEKPYSC